MVLFCRLQEGGRQAVVVTVLIELTECVVFSHDKDGAGSRLEKNRYRKGYELHYHTIEQQKRVCVQRENTTKTSRKYYTDSVLDSVLAQTVEVPRDELKPELFGFGSS